VNSVFSYIAYDNDLQSACCTARQVRRVAEATYIPDSGGRTVGFKVGIERKCISFVFVVFVFVCLPKEKTHESYTIDDGTRRWAVGGGRWAFLRESSHPPLRGALGRRGRRKAGMPGNANKVQAVTEPRASFSIHSPLVPITFALVVAPALRRHLLLTRLITPPPFTASGFSTGNQGPSDRLSQPEDLAPGASLTRIQAERCIFRGG
jgi:hypothetical protein